MNLGDVMDELGQALDTIEGLRVYPYWEANPSSPAAIVEWPTSLDFHTTMGRGSDTIMFPISIIIGRVDARTSRDALSRFANGSGEASVRAALEDHEYGSADSVTVQSAEFGVVVIAGVEYLLGRFQVHVMGSGN